MSRLNRIEKFFVYLLIVWTVFNIILWVTAKEGFYFEKDQFWPFINGKMEISRAYDFREFIIYTLVPWTLFFMIDNIAHVDHSEKQ